jgi:hypothetical protein
MVGPIPPPRVKGARSFYRTGTHIFMEAEMKGRCRSSERPCVVLGRPPRQSGEPAICLDNRAM